MFGATNSATSGSTGLFGNANQQKPGFGTTPTQPSSSFSFGSSNTNTSGFGASAPSNLLSSTNAAPAASSALPFSLGGSNTGTLTLTAQKPGGLFGNTTSTNSGASLFGNNNAAGTTNALGSSNTFGTPQTASAPSGGLFGKPATTSATPAFGASNTTQTSALGGLFGNKPASQTTGLFGGLTQNNTSAGTGLFGGQTQSNTSAGSGLFGGLTQNTTTGTGLFGASNTAQPSQPSTGLLGQSSALNSGGLFGASSSTNSQNVQQNQNAATGGLFSNVSNNPQPSFGWSNKQTTANDQPSTLSSNLLLNLAAPVQSQKSISNYTPAINDQILKLKELWDPSSSKCALKTYVYNRFSEQEIAVLLQQPRPADESSEDWENAMANRPSAFHYPIKVSSFSAVAQRIEVQLDHVARSRILLNKIYEQLNQLSSKHDLDNTTRILKAKVRHAKLSRRLLRLATVLAVLKLKGYPMLPEEEEMSKQLQTLNSRLNDPNGPLGKLSDLYARLAILKSRSEDMSAYMESSIQSINGGLSAIAGIEKDGSGDAAVGNEQIMNQLTKLLYKQQVGLSYLNDVVQKDLEKVNSITKGK